MIRQLGERHRGGLALGPVVAHPQSLARRVIAMAVNLIALLGIVTFANTIGALGVIVFVIGVWWSALRFGVFFPYALLIGAAAATPFGILSVVLHRRGWTT